MTNNLGCKFITIIELSISVADGRRLQTSSIFKIYNGYYKEQFLFTFPTYDTRKCKDGIGGSMVEYLKLNFFISIKIVDILYEGKKYVLKGAGTQHEVCNSCY